MMRIRLAQALAALALVSAVWSWGYYSLWRKAQEKYHDMDRERYFAKQERDQIPEWQSASAEAKKADEVIRKHDALYAEADALAGRLIIRGVLAFPTALLALGLGFRGAPGSAEGRVPVFFLSGAAIALAIAVLIAQQWT